MRNTFIVTYDVSEDRRRTKVHSKLKGFGDQLQYSVFRCWLSPSEKLILRSDLWELIDLATDRVLIVDLGPQNGRGSEMEIWGRPYEETLFTGGPHII